MSIVIDLAQDEEVFIRTAAGKAGVDPASYVVALVRRHLLQQKAKTEESLFINGKGTKPQRIGNLHPGNFHANDDFDDPLPDEFWLGEP